MARLKSSEAQIEERVLNALAGILDIEHLDVSAVGSALHIEGSVSGLRDKRRAAEIAGSMCGTARVVNHLRVAPAMRRKDEAIAKAAHSSLLFLEEEGPAKVRVRCRSGIVHLTGEVDSWTARQAADKAVRLVRGVMNVVNQLRVRRGEQTAKETEGEISKALRRFLFLDAVNVKFDGGTVRLTGTVPSPYHRLAAEDLVRWFSPVREVMNGLATAPSLLSLSEDADTIGGREASIPSA
jgi:osmotically-inducible protein OsmY